MKERSLLDLGENYELDLNKIVLEIKRKKAKLILLQFPDGLKPYAVPIVDYLNKKTKVEFLIFLGDCFGACDTPVGMEKLGIDLIIQFGHNSLMPNYLR